MFSDLDNQENVFKSVERVVKCTLDGQQVCIFAYGQTGSGKTYTMQGTPENRGLVPRSVEMIFSEVEERKKFAGCEGAKVSLSCFEIYMDNVTDLLDTTNF